MNGERYGMGGRYSIGGMGEGEDRRREERERGKEGSRK